MGIIAGATYREGVAYSPDGAMYVTPTGTASITGGNIGTGTTGVVTVLAQSAAPLAVPADVTEDTLVTVAVPANTLGANGAVRITTFWSMTNGANAKTGKVKFGTLSQTVMNSVVNIAALQSTTYVTNRNATNSQIADSFAITSSSAVASGAITGTAAIDTTASVNIVITGQKASAGDTLTLERYLIEVIH